MRKLFFISIPSLIVVLIVFLTVQLFIIPQNAKGALQITTTPQSKVSIDGKYIGTTPLCLCEPSTMLKAGNHELRLEPSDKSLDSFLQNITITKSVLTVVDRKFGKNGKTEGSIISLEPLSNNSESELSITSLPDKAEIFLDDTLVGQTPILIPKVTSSDHSIKIRKDGYNEKIVRIRTPKGYKLLTSITLSIGDLSQIVTPTPLASPSSSLTPSPTIALVSTVTILDTPNGFLRVRAAGSLDSAEIARVNTDEEFPYLDEANGWIKIKLDDGRMGWVSSQFVEKN